MFVKICLDIDFESVKFFIGLERTKSNLGYVNKHAVPKIEVVGVEIVRHCPCPLCLHWKLNVEKLVYFIVLIVKRLMENDSSDKS